MRVSRLASRAEGTLPRCLRAPGGCLGGGAWFLEHPQEPMGRPATPCQRSRAGGAVEVRKGPLGGVPSKELSSRDHGESPRLKSHGQLDGPPGTSAGRPGVLQSPCPLLPRLHPTCPPGGRLSPSWSPSVSSQPGNLPLWSEVRRSISAHQREVWNSFLGEKCAAQAVGFWLQG